MSLFSSKQNSSLLNLISSKLVEYSKKITFTPESIVCINISKSAAEQISETYPDSNMEFINFSDLVNSQFQKDDASVDLLIANIAMLKDVQPDILLADAKRVLKISGVLIFATFDSSSLFLLKKYNNELRNQQIFDEKKMLEQLTFMRSLHFSSLKEHLLATDKPDIYIDCDIFFVSYPKKLKPNVKEEKEQSAEFLESEAEERKELREKLDILEKELEEDSENEVEQEKEEEREKGFESESEPEEFEQKEREEIREETEEESEMPEHEKVDEQENEEELENTEKPEQEIENLEAGEKKEINERESEDEKREEIKDVEEVEEKEGIEDVEEGEEEEKEEIEDVEEGEEGEKKELSELEHGEEESDKVENKEQSQEVELDEEQEFESYSEEQQKEFERNIVSSEKNVHKIPLTVDERSKTLTRLESGIHQSREELADHEKKITHHLNSTISILAQLESKDLNKEYRADKIAELKKNLDQHKKMLATYRSLYDKHKTLLNNFINTHEQASQKDDNLEDRYHQLIREHQKLLTEHEDKISEHENFTNNLTI